MKTDSPIDRKAVAFGIRIVKAYKFLREKRSLFCQDNCSGQEQLLVLWLKKANSQRIRLTLLIN